MEMDPTNTCFNERSFLYKFASLELMQGQNPGGSI